MDLEAALIRVVFLATWRGGGGDVNKTQADSYEI